MSEDKKSTRKSDGAPRPNKAKVDGAGGEGEDDVKVHVIALKHFERTLRALNEAVERFEAEEEASMTDLRSGSADVRKAMQTVFDEIKRAAAKEGEGAQPKGLSLDDARDEVQRRMDSISRARKEG